MSTATATTHVAATTTTQAGTTGTAPGAGADRPVVSVVISTHRRPRQVREAIASVRGQRLPGVVETIVVFDAEAPDASLAVGGGDRPVRVLANHRTPGLAGSRNTGAAAAAAPVLGFCDDDDVWLPGRLSAQLELLARTGAPTVAGPIRIATPQGTHARHRTASAVRVEDLARSRIPEAYMGTVLVRAEAFAGAIGPVAEDLPGSYAEDYDWWLRAARTAPVPLVDEPCFELRWHGGSYYRERWDDIDEALGVLLARHPELAVDRRGRARVEAQRAFAAAAAGRRTDGVRRWLAAARLHPLEPRLPLAAAALAGVPGGAIVRTLNRTGRGV